MIQPSRKILLFANTDWYLYNFRGGLARALRAAGHEVVLVSPPGEYGPRLEAAGFRWLPLEFSPGSKSLRSNWRLCQRIKRLYGEERPDLVHHFTIKCVLYGGLAARKLGIPAVHSVTGLGHVFTDRSWRMGLIRRGVLMLYRRACDHPGAHTIFQNEEDRRTLLDCRAMAADRTTLIRGSGADCERFQPGRDGAPGCRILFASRLLREKGIVELVEATRQLRREGLRFELLLAGVTYPDNPSSLTEAELAGFSDDVRRLGHVEDMPGLLRGVDIVVLPSWREGTPRVLLEAGAAGKPLVATDIAGCRGVVIPGVNGELVPVQAPGPLADALRKLIVDPGLRERYGAASRENMVRNFSEPGVIRQTLAVYERLAGVGLPPARSSTE